MIIQVIDHPIHDIRGDDWVFHHMVQPLIFEQLLEIFPRTPGFYSRALQALEVLQKAVALNRRLHQEVGEARVWPLGWENVVAYGFSSSQKRKNCYHETALCKSFCA